MVDPLIPEGSLSWPQPAVPLPKYTPLFFMVQPYIESDPVYTSPASSSSSSMQQEQHDEGSVGACWTALESLVAPPEVVVDWAGETRWVEVSIGLLGSLGNMQALGPSIAARLPPSVKAAGVGDNGPSLSPPIPSASEVVHLSPIPPAVASASALDAARERAVAIADHLGLSGLARVDAFMHADTGELVVLEVDVLPDLSAGSPLYVQVSVHVVQYIT